MWDFLAFLPVRMHWNMRGVWYRQRIWAALSHFPPGVQPWHQLCVPGASSGRAGSHSPWRAQHVAAPLFSGDGVSTGTGVGLQQLRVVNLTGAAQLSYLQSYPPWERSSCLLLFWEETHMWCDFQGGPKSFKMGWVDDWAGCRWTEVIISKPFFLNMFQ